MEIPANILEYPIALALALVGWHVVKYFLAREDKKEEARERQEKLREQKDLAHIETLKTIQSGVVNLQTDQAQNWKVTKELSEGVVKLSDNMDKTTALLSNLQCFKKNINTDNKSNAI